MGTRDGTDAAAETPSPQADDAPADRRRPALLLPLAALAAGLLLLPLLIWVVGTRVLGAYTRASEGPAAGPAGLYQDFYSGLAHGVPAFWAAALGPLVLLFGVRLLWRLLRPAERSPIMTNQRGQ